MTALLPTTVPATSVLAIAAARGILIDKLHRLSTAQYRRMIETGILKESDQIELLDGYLVEKIPRNSPHDATMVILMRALFRAVPDGWEIRCQNALVLEKSQPEPDLAIVKQDPSRYRERDPTCRDAILVIEISNASLQSDLSVKALIYSHDNIPTY